MSNEEIDAQVNALLDMTGNNIKGLVEAVGLVCFDISMKESLRGDISSNNNSG